MTTRHRQGLGFIVLIAVAAVGMAIAWRFVVGMFLQCGCTA